MMLVIDCLKGLFFVLVMIKYCFNSRDLGWDLAIVPIWLMAYMIVVIFLYITFIFITSLMRICCYGYDRLKGKNSLFMCTKTNQIPSAKLFF